MVVRKLTRRHFVRLVKRAALAAVVLACAGTLMAPFGRLGALLEVASNLRLQYLLVLVPATLVLPRAGRPRLAALAGAAVLVNLVYVGALWVDPRPAEAHAAAPAHRALLLNAYYKNHDYPEILALLREKQPEVAVLVEVTPGLARALDLLADDFPYRRAYPRLDSGGVAILSRQPLESVARYPFGAWKRPVVVARTRIGGRPVTVVGMHPYSSRAVAESEFRRFQMQAVGDFLADLRGPVLLLGDLNVTPWSPLFADLLAESGLRDARKGFGVLPTYPALFPPLWMPLDHCLTSADVAVRGFRVGPRAGSDHLPVVVDFSFAPLDAP
jgi:endonuclease/exonuclease/phosphatase (EEP) superfamily protein YafD